MIPDRAAIDLAQIEVEERYAVAKADLVAAREVLAAARAGREPSDPAAVRRVADWLDREGASPDRDLIRRLVGHLVWTECDAPPLALNGERSFPAPEAARTFARRLPEGTPVAYVVVWRHHCRGAHHCEVCGLGYTHDVPSDGGPMAAAPGYRGEAAEQQIVEAARSAAEVPR